MMCSTVPSQFVPVERDDTQERFGCHVLEALWVMDFVEPCVFIMKPMMSFRWRLFRLCPHFISHSFLICDEIISH